MKKAVFVISVFFIAAACIYYFSNRNETEEVKEPEKKPTQQKAEQIEVIEEVREAPIPKSEFEQTMEQLKLKDGTLGKSKTVSRFAVTRAKVHYNLSRSANDPVYCNPQYYHRANCNYLRKKNKASIWLEKALEMGKRPCPKCKPPRD